MGDAIDARSLSMTAAKSWDRWEQTGDRVELDHAIAAFRAAVTMLGRERPERRANLYHLLCTLNLRYEEFGDVRDLEDAINAGGEAVELDPGHAGYHSALAALYYTRYLRLEDPSDLEKAVSLAREATSLPPTENSDTRTSLTNLAVALLARYRRYGSVADLEESIGLERTSLALSRPGSSRKASLINLAFELCDLFELRGGPDVLEEAMAFGRRAVNARPTDGRDQPKSLHALGHVLEVRHAHTGAPEDLDEAIASARRALEFSAVDRASREGFLAHLVTRLSTRSRVTNSAADIDEAVRLVRAHVAAGTSVPEGPQSGVSLLMMVLQRRYAWDGSIAYLDEAIAKGRDASILFTENTAAWARHMRVLSEMLFVRFRQFGSLADLNAAISQYRMLAVDYIGEPAHKATDISSLGMCLWARYERTEDREALDWSVELGRMAVEETEHVEDRAMCLANLGAALAARFERDGLLSDLDESISVTRSALAAEVRSTTDRARFHANLSAALAQRYKRTGEPEDLDQAVADGLRCAELTSERNPERAKFLCNLGGALAQRFARSRHDEDRNAAIDTYEHAWASDAAPIGHRIRAAFQAAKLIESSDPGRATELMSAAVHMLQLVSPRRLARSDQQEALHGAGELVSEAVALVLADDRAPEPERSLRALELLEIGRAVLIGQSLEGRDDLSELRVSHPEIAARFVELRDFLDQPSEPARPPSTARNRLDEIPVSAPDTVRDRPELAAEFDALLNRIRGMEGFEAFGRPPSQAELREAAREGPIVMLNVSSRGGHAILVTRTGVTAKVLDGLDMDALHEMFEAFQGARRAVILSSDPEQRREAGPKFACMLELLWDTVAGPVLDALGLTQALAPHSDAWPRVWWIPCGLLSALPIHAAGYHAAPSSERAPQAVIDCVVSSYTPSTRMLLHTRRRTAQAESVPSPRPLAIAMPTTPGLADQGRLPNVPGEVAALRRHFPLATVLEGDATGARGPTAAVREHVLARLPEHEIVHFACHGQENPDDPSQSRLLLADHESNPLTVAALSPLDLTRAQLAYLSACNTGSPLSFGLTDESIHLASAFQIMGFDHVVSTLWEIDDRVSIAVADSFYANLYTGSGHVDVRHAAKALHHALRDARDSKDRPGLAGRRRNPFLWAAYIHVGA